MSGTSTIVTLIAAIPNLAFFILAAIAAWKVWDCAIFLRNIDDSLRKQTALLDAISRHDRQHEHRRPTAN